MQTVKVKVYDMYGRLVETKVEEVSTRLYKPLSKMEYGALVKDRRQCIGLSVSKCATSVEGTFLYTEKHTYFQGHNLVEVYDPETR